VGEYADEAFGLICMNRHIIMSVGELLQKQVAKRIANFRFDPYQGDDRSDKAVSYI
jgi:hypothetical protein